MKKKSIISFVIITTILVLVIFLLKDKNSPKNYDEFAKCLSEKEVSMYGTYWCPHCKNQKEMFGSSFKYVNYIECTENQDLCDENGVSGYPTWIIDGKQYSGEQTLKKLSGLTGCDLNS